MKRKTRTLKFGKGKIAMPLIERSLETIGIAFVESEEGVVGRFSKEFSGKTIEELNPEVVMEFENIESLDVLINQLMSLKEHMVSEV